MTRIHKGALVFVSVLLVFALAGCDFFGFEYQVGDIGPGGGIIFFVDSSNNFPGWTYLEAAPLETEFASLPWGLNGVDINISPGTNLGDGSRNTNAIVSAHGTLSNAARSTRQLVHNGLNDWYLPSRDELQLMYEVLYSNGLGDFASGNYWSSSFGSSNGRGVVFSFNTGSWFFSSDRATQRRVRAIRRFL